MGNFRNKGVHGGELTELQSWELPEGIHSQNKGTGSCQKLYIYRIKGEEANHSEKEEDGKESRKTKGREKGNPTGGLCSEAAIVTNQRGYQDSRHCGLYKP